MASKAGVGRGTIVSIGTSAATPVFYKIGELKEVNQTGSQWGTEDVTNFDSGVDMEFVTTIRDNGEYSVSGNRIPSDPGYTEFINAYNDGLNRQFKVQLPVNHAAGQTTIGDIVTFVGLVQSVDQAVAFNKALTWSGKIKVTGAPATAQGS